jgi:hypothetical protein
VHLDQRLGTLAVAGDLLGERQGDLVHRGFERLGGHGTGGAAREHDRGVAGAGVGVDRHAVEGAVDHPAEHRVELVGRDGRRR